MCGGLALLTASGNHVVPFLQIAATAGYLEAILCLGQYVLHQLHQLRFRDLLCIVARHLLAAHSEHRMVGRFNWFMLLHSQQGPS